MEVTLRELAERINCHLQGDSDHRLTGCAALEVAGPQDLSFVANPHYESMIEASRAGCIVVSAAVAARYPGRSLLIADDPYFAFRQALVMLHRQRQMPAAELSERAFVDPAAKIGSNCTIQAGAFVAAGARLGDRVVLYPHVYIGEDAVIGDDCVLHPGVCVYHGCILGQRVTLHANTVIGQDGLGYATAKAPGPGAGAGDDIIRHHKLPHIGNVVIEDDVEMGAGCAIDRATLGSTIIGEGSKLSDLVVIGHGAHIGRHNLLVAHVGIAGSTTTGDYVVMGGHVGVAGHLIIGDHVEIAADAKVMHNIPAGQQWGGTPARPLIEAKRIALSQRKLPELIERVRQLELRLEALGKAGGEASPLSCEP